MKARPRFDRAAICRDAHVRYRQGKRLGLGWTFSQCMKTAWSAARKRQSEVREYYQPTPRRLRDLPFPIMPAAIVRERDFIRL